MEYNQDIQIRTSKTRQTDHLKSQVNNIFTDNFDYPEDATEEEQEDLPYDGDLKKPSHHNNESNNLKAYVSVENISDNFLNLTCSEMNRNLNEEINYKTQYLPQEKVFSHCTSATRTNEITTEKAIEAPVCGTSLEMELSVGACRIPDRKEHFINSKISDLLLHHFSKEELSNTSQLIDCETIPELSFAESVDETVLTKTRISECTKATFLTEQWAKHFEDDCLNIQEEIYQDDCKYKHLLDDNKCVIDDRATSYGEERDCIQENSQLTAENEDANNFQNIRKNHTNQKGLFERTGSSHELKYGQGQVNYCLPDFSKVASKVKIPKRNNNDKSAPKMKRTKFSPNLVGKSAIVKDVLETMNYFDSVKVKNQEEEGMKIPELLQQIELLTKHAEDQNCIDHWRFDAKIYPHSDSPNPNLSIHSRCMGAASEVSIFHPLSVPIQPMVGVSQSSFSGLQDGRMISSLPSATAAGEIHCSNPNSMENTTKGEKMSQMLKEQAEQLKTKVEEFSKCVIQETLPLQDRCLALQELKGCLDTLERNYLATKEKHRGLQLQNYNHKSTSIGKFDPDRKLEGEIFRLGMLLEDVKEKIDDNRCSPYPSSFTSPTSPSLTPCESVWSSSSCVPESPTVSIISDPPERSAIEVNFHNNNKRNEEENRSHVTDVIPKKTSQLSLQDDNCDPFPKIQLVLQKRDASAFVRGMEPLEKAQLLANKHSSNEMQCFFPPEADNGAGGQESHKQLILNEKLNSDQENPKGSSNFWQMSSSKAKPYNVCNLDRKIINLNVHQEQGNIAYPSDSFCGRMENYSNSCDAILHPKWKIHCSKNANKEFCSCSVNRNKKTENRKTENEKSKCGRYSVFIQEKAVELDLSGSDTEDISFCDSFNKSHNDEFMEHRTKNSKSHRAGLKEQSKALQYRDWNANFCTSCQRNKCIRESDKDNIASSFKKKIAAKSACKSTQPEQFVYELSDKFNLEIPKTCCSKMHDTIIFSPQYLPSRKVYESKSMIGIRNRQTNDTDTKILNSTLDHAIQTATCLKKTTERMMQVVAEDLAKVKTHRSKQFNWSISNI